MLARNVAKIPAWKSSPLITAPSHTAIPPRYAMAMRSSELTELNVVVSTPEIEYAKSVPPIPAMNAEMAKAMSFVPATFTPAAAAARSFDRTASIRRPSRERRTATTDQMTRPRTSAQKTGNAGSGIHPDQFPGPNLNPKIEGGATFACDCWE